MGLQFSRELAEDPGQSNSKWALRIGGGLTTEHFDVRATGTLPDLTFDLTGRAFDANFRTRPEYPNYPGSPFEDLFPDLGGGFGVSLGGSLTVKF